MQLAQDIPSEVVSSVEEFDALLGVKADEIIKNRDLIRWCKQNFQNLHFKNYSKKCQDVVDPQRMQVFVPHICLRLTLLNQMMLQVAV